MKGFKRRQENQLLALLLEGFLLKNILLSNSFNVIEEYPIGRFPFYSFFTFWFQYC